MIASWLSIPENTDFSFQNFPLGVFSASLSETRRCATVLGDTVIDLSVLEAAGMFQGIDGLACNVFNKPALNDFIEHPAKVWLEFRERLIQLFVTDGSLSVLRKNHDLQKLAFHPRESVVMHLPIEVASYTDFYASREHATNVGQMFRSKENALNPNWLHLPVGYHGRASTVVVSGQTVRRPKGQLQRNPMDPKQGSLHGPTQRLDFELEMAAVVGGPANPLGHPLSIKEAKDRIFGYLLLNDWSARDIQKWEYVPLGPFTSKNFCTTVSPWIVMTAALEDFEAETSAGAQTEPVPLRYLRDPDYSSYDIQLSVDILPKDQAVATTVCKSNFRNMYWNPAQQLVHHSVTGCVMKPGDLLGSGTISGKEDGSFGSMLELSWNGSKDIALSEKSGGGTRHFLEDGDTIILRGFCEERGVGRVGFGTCEGMILPAFKDGEILPKDDSEKQNAVSERYTNMKLHGFWRSSSSWRVRIALAAKAIEHTTIPVDVIRGEHKKEEYLKNNPLGEVPMLECTDTLTNKVIRLTNSVAIIVFLDDAFPTRWSMIPKDPIDRAVAMELVEMLNTLQQNTFLLGDLEKQTSCKINAAKEAKRLNIEMLNDFETLMERHRENAPGPFCMGTFSPTIVDAVLIPQIYNARRFGVNIKKDFRSLAEIDALCASHPWFRAALPSRQPDAVDDKAIMLEDKSVSASASGDRPTIIPGSEEKPAAAAKPGLTRMASERTQI